MYNKLKNPLLILSLFIGTSLYAPPPDTVAPFKVGTSVVIGPSLPQDQQNTYQGKTGEVLALLGQGTWMRIKWNNGNVSHHVAGEVIAQPAYPPCPEAAPPAPPSPVALPNEAPRPKSPAVEHPPAVACDLCGDPQHTAYEHKCKNCQRCGHRDRDCPKLRQAPPAPPSPVALPDGAPRPKSPAVEHPKPPSDEEKYNPFNKMSLLYAVLMIPAVSLDEIVSKFNDGLKKISKDLEKSKKYKKHKAKVDWLIKKIDVHGKKASYTTSFLLMLFLSYKILYG